MIFIPTGEDVGIFVISFHREDDSLRYILIFEMCDELVGYIKNGPLYPTLNIVYGPTIVSRYYVEANGEEKIHKPPMELVNKIKVYSLPAMLRNPPLKNISEEINYATGCNVEWTIVDVDMENVVVSPNTKECCVAVNMGLNSKRACKSQMIIRKSGVTLTCGIHGERILNGEIAKNTTSLFF